MMDKKAGVENDGKGKWTTKKQGWKKQEKENGRQEWKIGKCRTSAIVENSRTENANKEKAENGNYQHEMKEC